jgi:hypothetical protein
MSLHNSSFLNGESGTLDFLEDRVTVLAPAIRFWSKVVFGQISLNGGDQLADMRETTILECGVR